MRRVIRYSVVLPAPADELYATYMDAARHAELTGAPVTIDSRPGSIFRAFNGGIVGTVLAAVPPRLAVLSWRSTNFAPDDPDSTLILAFIPEGLRARIELVQLDVPEADFQGIGDGWEKYYWAPWRAKLAKALSTH